MDTEQITADLNRRFAEPLPEFYKRRIIVWHDEEREFVDKVDEIILDNAKIIVLTGTNYFSVKKLLGVDDTESNYLLYSPCFYETPEDNWLLDIELYSEDFRADSISMWVSEMGLEENPKIRSAIKAYKKFMNSKERRKKFMLQTPRPISATEVQLAIMSALAGIKDAKHTNIIKAVLSKELNTTENTILKDFVNYEIDASFWRMAAQGTGYDAEEKDIGRLAIHIMLTASSRVIYEELRKKYMVGLEKYISTPHQAYCYDLISDWLYAKDNDILREIAKYVEKETNLYKRFMQIDTENLLNIAMFPCVNEIIILKLIEDIEKNIIDPAKIRQIVEKRRALPWYEDVRNFYEGLYQVANIQEFYKNHSGGFHTTEPKKIWEEYASDYYKMDAYYRLFHKSYTECEKMSSNDLFEAYRSIKDIVENCYVNWFLEELGTNWSDAIADNLREKGKIDDVPLQTDFYSHKVASSDSKVYVIISDAMRYEVAAELAEVLRRETQSKVTISAMQGIFPTVTKFGMAALLPHKKLSVELKSDKLSVLADGESTEAGNREKVLKSEKSKSVALKYKDIINLKRAERAALARGMDVVYIYHDAIDEAGHLDTFDFGACTKAIEEIKNMVRIITGEFGGTHILITSDHGFLCTVNSLREDDKADKSSTNEQAVEIARRYVITKKGTDLDYLLPVKFLEVETEYNAFTPRGNIRLKMKGGGLNFVHGGVSLQEMAVPLIDYHFLRNDSKEYKNNKAKYATMPVTIGLLSSSRKINNMIFSLTFYQKEAAAANFRAATYKLYFTDSTGQQVSDAPQIIADKTEEDADKRIYRVSFNLKSLKYDNKEKYYLVIEDEDGVSIAREEFRIDIAFAVDEFDF
ncbi:MAG: BREX-1 system phosphatase PglZ type A [Selenomonadaceae bacterium]|nr:BREX-1 system phosphatase PglZ type A [Selenomonadaceae bacterium]